jgi:hypothetical protein
MGAAAAMAQRVAQLARREAEQVGARDDADHAAVVVDHGQGLDVVPLQ